MTKTETVEEMYRRVFGHYIMTATTNYRIVINHDPWYYDVFPTSQLPEKILLQTFFTRVENIAVAGGWRN